MLPPDELISSARAVLLRGDEVMVIHDHLNVPYIIPGGRREPGETVLEALQREMREETGWSVRDTAVIGCVHFQPQTQRLPLPAPPLFLGHLCRPDRQLSCCRNPRRFLRYERQV